MRDHKLIAQLIFDKEIKWNKYTEHGTWQVANVHSTLTVYFCIVITEKPQAIYRKKLSITYVNNCAHSK